MRLRSGSSVAGAALLLATLMSFGSVARAQEHMEKTLYQRLGGYDALAAVTDDFIARLATDAQLGVFFKGHSADSLKRIRQHIVDQLCFVTGGPCYYTGRDMREAHAGMGITQAQWDIMAKHMTATFDKFKVPERERGEVFAAITSLKKDIVEQ